MKKKSCLQYLMQELLKFENIWGNKQLGKYIVESGCLPASTQLSNNCHSKNNGPKKKRLKIYRFLNSSQQGIPFKMKIWVGKNCVEKSATFLFYTSLIFHSSKQRLTPVLNWPAIYRQSHYSVTTQPNKQINLLTKWEVFHVRLKDIKI